MFVVCSSAQESLYVYNIESYQWLQSCGDLMWEFIFVLICTECVIDSDNEDFMRWLFLSGCKCLFYILLFFFFFNSILCGLTNGSGSKLK